MKTPCCNYEAPAHLPWPVKWNHGNKVVQCHNCGCRYVPEQMDPKGERAIVACKSLLTEWDRCGNERNTTMTLTAFMDCLKQLRDAIK